MCLYICRSLFAGRSVKKRTGDVEQAASGYWTPKQYAERRQTSENQLYGERRSGGGPPFVIFGRCSVRYPVAEALAWEKEQQVRSIGEHLSADAERARAVAELQGNVARARRTRHRKTAESETASP
jgi:hypothetical protein